MLPLCYFCLRNISSLKQCLLLPLCVKLCQFASPIQVHKKGANTSWWIVFSGLPETKDKAEYLISKSNLLVLQPESKKIKQGNVLLYFTVFPDSVSCMSSTTDGCALHDGMLFCHPPEIFAPTPQRLLCDWQLTLLPFDHPDLPSNNKRAAEEFFSHSENLQTHNRPERCWEADKTSISHPCFFKGLSYLKSLSFLGNKYQQEVIYHIDASKWWKNNLYSTSWSCILL